MIDTMFVPTASTYKKKQVEKQAKKQVYSPTKRSKTQIKTDKKKINTEKRGFDDMHIIN
jgi:hypothetical protein